ncbi:MAG: lysophospholipid acyltransferase family protein [Prevotellaceae bacterium]|jgi:KDO2-lipid IV(A) lauroyltransferase|nr:lysophospholipid acyltransferase family protein [Prevotellaceae bacterium]
MAFFYYILYAFVWLLAWLPLPILYVFSEIAFVLTFYVVRYRRKVVRLNLQNSFPEKSLSEIKRIERRFYRHFCDVFIESLKMLHISEKEMQRRMNFPNIAEVIRIVDNGGNVILMLGHYCNWEFMVSIRLFVPNRNVDGAGVYRRLKNPYMDKFFQKLRTRFGTLGIEKNDIFREIIKHRKANKQLTFALISDQTPSRNNIHYWTTFLNQDTPVLIGGERIARQTGYVLYYVDIVKKKRGTYEANLILISDDVKSTPEFECTEKFMRLLENSIRREPAYWLWTHKRWKHKREAN